VSPAEGIRKIAGENILVKENNGKNISTAVSIAKESDVVILMLGDHQSEGSDHSIALNGNQDSLAFAVLAANPNTIVVLKSGGPVLMPWVNKAPAIIEAWYPGEEDGDAVASVLFGKINPSGKLPITFPEKMDDLPLQTADQYPGIDYVQHYTEGLLVGYRWYDTKNIEPLFPFGYGLSYTTFSYNDLKVSSPDKKKGVVVEFNVTNTGNREGAEVAQVYVSLPSNTEVPQPLRQLKGFKRVELTPGQSAHISIPLDIRALSYWNQSSHSWKVLTGNYTVYAAASSRDLRLTGTFTLK
ncbi:MAG: glycoside hydrolase family 3 C-terminal domain-containing protein, partial [Bacteroidota bacterium]|nr:glycoside hydrolase family 3 C-terminal domain-containing protein [Bacteroidota bacterium]